MTKHWVFIDVDGTLIDQHDTPRPHILDLFEKIKSLGCTIVVWSAGGHDYAERKIGMISRKLNIDLSKYVDHYWWKAWHKNIVIPYERFYIDDVPEMLAAREDEGHGIFLVPFYDPSVTDNWLLAAADAVENWFNTEK